MVMKTWDEPPGSSRILKKLIDSPPNETIGRKQPIKPSRPQTSTPNLRLFTGSSPSRSWLTVHQLTNKGTASSSPNTFAVGWRSLLWLSGLSRHVILGCHWTQIQELTHGSSQHR